MNKKSNQVRQLLRFRKSLITRGILITVILVGVYSIASSATSITSRPRYGELKPSPATTIEQPVIHDIELWKSYNDNISDFSILYPPGWKIVEQEPGEFVSISSYELPYNRRIEVVFEDNTTNLDPESYIRMRLNSVSPQKGIGDIVNIQPITLKNISGILVTGIPEGLTNIEQVFVSKHGKGMIRISLLDGGEIGGKIGKPKANEDFDVFLKTISSFTAITSE